MGSISHLSHDLFTVINTTSVSDKRKEKKLCCNFNLTCTFVV